MLVLVVATPAVSSTSQSCCFMHASCKASTVPQPDQLTFCIVKLLISWDGDIIMVSAVNADVEQVMDGVLFTFVVGCDASSATMPGAPISCMWRVINGNGLVRTMLRYRIAVWLADEVIQLEKSASL